MEENLRFIVEITINGEDAPFCFVPFKTIEESNNFIGRERPLNPRHLYVLKDQNDSLEYRNKIIEEKRKLEYEKAGLTFEAIAEALIEKESGDTTKLSELITLRDGIRLQLPKE